MIINVFQAFKKFKRYFSLTDRQLSIKWIPDRKPGFIHKGSGSYRLVMDLTEDENGRMTNGGLSFPEKKEENIIYFLQSIKLIERLHLLYSDIDRKICKNGYGCVFAITSDCKHCKYKAKKEDAKMEFRENEGFVGDKYVGTLPLRFPKDDIYYK